MQYKCVSSYYRLIIALRRNTARSDALQRDAMRRKRDINSKGPHDTAPRKTPSTFSGRQIMNWFELISEEDVELLMKHVDRFHDWYVAGFP